MAVDRTDFGISVTLGGKFGTVCAHLFVCRYFRVVLFRSEKSVRANQEEAEVSA